MASRKKSIKQAARKHKSGSEANKEKSTEQKLIDAMKEEVLEIKHPAGNVKVDKAAYENLFGKNELGVNKMTAAVRDLLRAKHTSEDLKKTSSEYTQNTSLTKVMLGKHDFDTMVKIAEKVKNLGGTGKLSDIIAAMKTVT